MTGRPIGEYWPAPATLLPYDPRSAEVARRVTELLCSRRPGLRVEHIGSTSVPGLGGKGVVDLLVPAYQFEIPALSETALGLGFQRQSSREPFPPNRPLLTGAFELDGTAFRLHLHLVPHGPDVTHHLGFRDALRREPQLRAEYVAAKNGILAGGPIDSLEYSYAKSGFVRRELARLGLLIPDPILPPATIGILGGGQLGRMVGMAARDLGYRIAVLDPDPDCPAAAVADRVVVGRYDDGQAALELARASAVLTYELEHVGASALDAVIAQIPVRPGLGVLRATQDRLAERRALRALGIPTALWREVVTIQQLVEAAGELAFPLRLKVAVGGYDGRSQLRLTDAADLESAFESLGGSLTQPLLVEHELDFEAELSVTCARGLDGNAAAFPVVQNNHDGGILVESVAPAPIAPGIAGPATELAIRLATDLEVVGTLTVELFQLRDGTLAVNELAPRVHNSGHYTIEACRTSQFEQHVRAICGLPLGSPEQLRPAAMVNLLGSGPARDARLIGLELALEDPLVRLHLYDKRRVFERRKMGHLTALASDTETVEDALGRARRALAGLAWAP